MLESDLERQVVEWVESKGGRCLKLKLDNQRGFMDRTIWLPGGLTVEVELKIPGGGGVRSAHQIEWMNTALRLGRKSFFCDNFDDFKRQMGLWYES